MSIEELEQQLKALTPETRDLTLLGLCEKMLATLKDTHVQQKAVDRALIVYQENIRLIEAIEEARKTLPTDEPSFNKPWSQCIAILDETLENP